MSIIRVGLAETKRFAEGYDAIFGKKTASKKPTTAKAETGKKPAKKKPAAKKKKK